MTQFVRRRMRSANRKVTIRIILEYHSLEEGWRSHYSLTQINANVKRCLTNKKRLIPPRSTARKHPFKEENSVETYNTPPRSEINLPLDIHSSG